MKDLLNRLEKSASMAGVFKGVGNYIKNISGHNVRKLESEKLKTNMNSDRWVEIGKELPNARVDRRRAIAGTAVAGVTGGATLGGYSAYQKSKEPVVDDLMTENQTTQQNKIANELDELLNKSASENLLNRLEKTASEPPQEPDYKNHAIGSAVGAGITAPIGGGLGMLGGIGAAKGSISGASGVLGKSLGALKGGALIGAGTALGTAAGAVPGSVLGGAVGSLGDLADKETYEKELLNHAIKEEIKNEYRMNREASSEDVLSRLEKTANFFSNIGKATGLQARKLQKSYDEISTPEAFLRNEPEMGAINHFNQVDETKQNLDQAILDRDQARSELVGPAAIGGMGLLGATGIGLSVMEMQKLHAEALAELEQEEAGATATASEPIQEEPVQEQNNPRQGAGSVSHAPAGEDKTASELMERLEKSAREWPSFQEAYENDYGHRRGVENDQRVIAGDHLPYTAATGALPGLGAGLIGSSIGAFGKSGLGKALGTAGTTAAGAGLGYGWGKGIQHGVQHLTEATVDELENKKHLTDQEQFFLDRSRMVLAPSQQAQPEEKVASLIESLEKTAKLGAIKPLATKAVDKIKDFSSKVKGTQAKADKAELGDLKASKVVGLERYSNLKNTAASTQKETNSARTKLGVGAGLVGAGAVAGAALSKDDDSEKVAEVVEETSINKIANPEDDLLNGLFKEAAAAIINEHIPAVTQYVDPLQRITFSK